MATKKQMAYTLQDGRTGTFSAQHFKEVCWKAQHNQDFNTKRSQQDIFDEIAETINVSQSSLKHWYFGHNVPNEFEKIEALAEYFQIPAADLLNFDEDEENIDMKQNEMTIKPFPENKPCENAKEAIEGIYSTMVAFIETYDAADDKDSWSLLKLLQMYLMLNRWSIPKVVHDELSRFAANYLQQMLTYKAYSDYHMYSDDICGEAPSVDQYYDMGPWWPDYLVADIEPDYEPFMTVVSEDLADMDFPDMLFHQRRNSRIIRGAYIQLEKILKDYLPQ